MADIILTPKAPGETVRYDVSFPEIDPDTITSVICSVTSGTISISTDLQYGDADVYPIVSGGASGETAVFTVTIQTGLGQTRIKTCSLFIATSADSSGPDSTITKATIVIRALGKLGIANYVFDTEAEEDNSALRQLDSLGAKWQDSLEQLPYSLPATNGTSSPSDSAGIDEADVDAFVYNLAEVLAPDYGKSPAGVAKRAADTRSDLFVKYEATREIAMPRRQPTGAGNDRWFSRRRFFTGG